MARRPLVFAAALLSSTLAHASLAHASQPPIQRPTEVLAEPEPEPEPPAIELPGLATEPPTNPEPARSEPNDDLPSYKSPAALEPFGDPAAEPEDKAEDPGLEVPQAGKGMMAVGAVLLGSGGLMLVSSPVLAATGYTDAAWGPALTLGLISTTAGSLFLGFGRRRHKRYQSWVGTQAERPPAQGYGLAASGGILIIGGGIAATVGTVGSFIGAVGFPADDSRPLNLAYTVLGVGVGSLVTGSVLTTVGVRRNKQFHTWRKRADQTPIELTPSVSPILGGAQIGLSGRF